MTAKVLASSFVLLGGTVGARTTMGVVRAAVAAGRYATHRKNTRERRRTDEDPATMRMRCVVQTTSSRAPGRRGVGGGGDGRGGGGGGGVDGNGTEGGGIPGDGGGSGGGGKGGGVVGGDWGATPTMSVMKRRRFIFLRFDGWSLIFLPRHPLRFNMSPRRRSKDRATPS